MARRGKREGAGGPVCRPSCPFPVSFPLYLHDYGFILFEQLYCDSLGGMCPGTYLDVFLCGRCLCSMCLCVCVPSSVPACAAAWATPRGSSTAESTAQAANESESKEREQRASSRP